MATPRKRITFRTPVRKKIQRNKKNNQAPIDKQIMEMPKPETSLNKPPIIPDTVDQKKNKKIIKKETEDKIDTKGTKNNDLMPYEIDDYLKLIENRNKAENDLIEAYKNENAFLRRIKNDNNLYKKFLGLEIKEIEEMIHEFAWEIKNNEIRKKIVFRLAEDENDYSYELIDSENCFLPEALEGCINFDKSQLMKFFLNVHEILLSKNN
ncbi:hypothetical protein GVAV_003427 [Gurleya vavrai]